MTHPFPIHIRWMIHRDMPRVLEIESLSFAAPWTNEDFIRCLRQRACIGMVAEHDCDVVGMMVYELRKRSLVVRDFAVHPDWRRRGVGTAMVGKLKQRIEGHMYRELITTTVSERNLIGHLFWRACGFKAVEIISQPFEDDNDDAYRFEYRDNAVAEC